MVDMVNHPPHYNSSEAKCTCGRQIECIDVTRHLNFNLGNVVKYVWRHSHKDGLEGLRKAQWYLNDEIKKLEAQEVTYTPVNFSRPTLTPE